MTTPLDKVIEAIGNVRDDNRGMTMHAVDVINRLQMNDRQQHNYERLDAQVDAILKAKNNCYTAPKSPFRGPEGEAQEADVSARHNINSPTINIGVEAALAMAKEVGTGATGETPPAGLLASIPSWLKTAGLLMAGAGTVYAINALFPGTDLDTRNFFDLQAVPFDPTTPTPP